MTQSHPPKLVLQINVPTTFSLPFGDYKEINGQYGMSFLYAVDVAGVRHGLFADVKLHQAMLNAGTGPGVELTVTKTQESFEKDGEQRLDHRGRHRPPYASRASRKRRRGTANPTIGR